MSNRFNLIATLSQHLERLNLPYVRSLMKGSWKNLTSRFEYGCKLHVIFSWGIFQIINLKPFVMPIFASGRYSSFANWGVKIVCWVEV